MAKASKKRNAIKGGKKNSRLSKKRSKTMKKAKNSGNIKKMMADCCSKPRKVYCLKCKKKVMITDYTIEQNKRGTYQIKGVCKNKTCCKTPTKVMAFIAESDI